jgi:hypothetical protein
VLARILFEDVPSVASFRPQVPAAISRLIDRMLAKEARDRPGDALALAEILSTLDAPMESGLQATLPAMSRSPRWAGQQLFSVVLASSPSLAALGAAARPADVETDGRRRESLETALVELGAHAEWLLDGSLVVAQATTGSATDQALKAARLALLIKERWPEATVVLATGRGAVQNAIPIGEVVDRATSILDRRRAAETGPALRVWLDDVSAGLLERRFVVGSEHGHSFLAGAETTPDDAHQLLGKPTPCVGRELELTTLTAVLASCIEDSEAHAVLITAPAGAGKSRLRREFLRRVRAGRPDVGVLLGVGDMMSAGAPYGILASALRGLCGITGSETLEDQRLRLAARSCRHIPADDRSRVADFLGELCGIHFPDDDNVKLRAARQDPRLMRDQIAAAFLDWLAAECRQQPLLLVLEDLHWGDALTNQLIDRALREQRNDPWMVLGLARSEIQDLFPNLWQGHALHALSLGGLSRKACQRLIQEVLGEAVSEEICAQLYAQSEGNALFLEEFIRAVREDKADTLPGTVLAMLQARISRLPADTQQTLLTASVFGPIFWAGGVRALLSEGERYATGIDADLRHLLECELIERRASSRFAGEDEYEFRHALMREAAYSLLGDERRAASHLLAARFLEAAGESEPMVVGEHYRCAGALDLAVPHLVRGAIQAFDSNDLIETLSRTRAALACDPQGEQLGVLLGLQSYSFFWTYDLEASYKVGQRAVPLLPPGTRHWCHAMFGLIAAVDCLPQLARAFPALVAVVLDTVPTADGAVAFFEVLSYVAITTSAVGQRSSAEACLEYMLNIGAASEMRGPQIELWTKYASAYHFLLMQADPWRTRTLAQEMCIAAEAIGLPREGRQYRGTTGALIAALCLLGLAELQLTGAEGEETVRRGLEVMRSCEVVGVELYYAALLCVHIADRGDAQTMDALEQLAARVLAHTGSAFAVGLAHCAQIYVHMYHGRLDQAEALVTRVDEILRPMPSHHIFASLCSIRLALARADADAALAQAEAGLRVLAAMGGGGPVEVKLRLAASEAFAAAGDLERARRELTETLRQIELRADRISDQEYRRRFLDQIPENVRARRLADMWLGTGASTGLA